MPADKTLFGQIALSRELVTKEALSGCLEIQESGPGQRIMLGQIMVNEGILTAEQVAEILAIQRRMRQSRVIKGYELLGKIGSGGMGTVYKARKEGIDKIVALKILSPSLARNEDYISRFFREARAAGKLNHPNIVAGFDVGESGGYYYFAMEYVEGRTVNQILAGEGRISEDRALNIVSQVAEALNHAAAQGLVHRDIKPDNIIVTESALVKLADLGLAKAHMGDPSLTQEGRTIGTPYYSSPEQARGELDIDIRSDIYSLGATLFNMISGRVPFSAASATAVFAKHMTEALPPLHEMKQEFSEPVARLIRKMMAKDRGKRHASPAELIESIRQTVLEIHREAASAEAGGRAHKKPKRSLWPAIALAAVAALAVVVLASGLLSPEKPGESGGSVGPAGDVGQGEQPVGAKGDDPKEARKAAAESALEQVRAFQEKNPRAYPLILAAYGKIIEEFSDTDAVKAARRQLEDTLKRRDSDGRAAAESAKADAEALAADERFGTAIKRWEALEASAAALGIEEQVTEEIAELTRRAREVFARESGHADKLLAEKNFLEARRAYQSVAEKSGLKEIEDKAREALAKIDELEREERTQEIARQLREEQHRAKIFALNDTVGKLKLDEARQAYEGLEEDCPEKLLGFLKERRDDLELLAGLRKRIIDAINASPGKARTIVLDNGQVVAASSCRASEERLIMKIKKGATEAEMPVGWDRISGGKLNDLAREAAPDDHVSLALLAYYTGMYNAAERHLQDAAEQEALRGGAARLEARFEGAARFRRSAEIHKLIDEARAAVENREAQRAQKTLDDLEERLTGDLKQQFGFQVEALIEQNNETLAEAEVERAKEEAGRRNWQAVSEILAELKKNFGRTRTVREKSAADILDLQVRSERLLADPDMLQAVRLFVKMEDKAAIGLFTAIARGRKGSVAKDAQTFLKALEMPLNLPEKECDDLIDFIRADPDPWFRVMAYRTFRKRCGGSRNEAYARGRIGTAFLELFHRPVWAREVFLGHVKDFKRYDNWVAYGYESLGHCEAAAENWPEAERYYDLVCRKYPKEHAQCARAAYAKARHYDEIGQTDKAVKILEEAVVKYRRGTGGAQRFLGQLYRDKLNDPQRALEAFEGAYTRNFESPEIAGPAMLEAAELLVKLDREEEARRVLIKLVNIFPDTRYEEEAARRLRDL